MGRVDGRRVCRPGRPSRGRPAPPRTPAGSADAPHDAQPPGLPLVRRRGAVPAGHTGEHLQLVVTRGDPVPGRSRRGGDRRGGGRRLPGADPQGPRRSPAAEAHLRHQRSDRGAARGGAPGCGAPRRGPTRPADPGRRDVARRPGHPHLHLGHHRTAEGRDDQPAQRGLHRRAAPPVHRPRRHRRQAADLIPADGPHRRADDQPLPEHGGRADGHVLPRPDPDRGLRAARCTPRSCSACPACGRRSTWA